MLAVAANLPTRCRSRPHRPLRIALTLLPPTEKVNLKRQPAQPREARTISTKENAPETLAPIAYDTYI
jgi:hypothetical protein